MLDPNLDEENGILKNKLNITNEVELGEAEANLGFLKLINVDSIDAKEFNEETFKRIHKHIFEDIYSWAGEYRTVPIVKEELVLPGYTIPYSNHLDISKDLHNRMIEINNINWECMELKEIAIKFSRSLALIWKVHPFREGNTSTTLAFAYLFAKEHGFPLDITTLLNNIPRQYNESKRLIKYGIRDTFALACLDEKDYPEVEHLARIIYKAIKDYSEKE